MIAESFGGWGFMCQDGEVVFQHEGVENVWETSNDFLTPESAVYDDKRNVIYVSNFDMYNSSSIEERQFVSTFLDLPTSVLKKLAEDAERNALILAEIGALYLKNRNIIVFALSVEHAHLLTEMLTIRNIEARCVDGTTNNFDRQRYIAEYKEGKIKVC